MITSRRPEPIEELFDLRRPYVPSRPCSINGSGRHAGVWIKEKVARVRYFPEVPLAVFKVRAMLNESRRVDSQQMSKKPPILFLPSLTIASHKVRRKVLKNTCPC